MKPNRGSKSRQKPKRGSKWKQRNSTKPQDVPSEPD